MKAVPTETGGLIGPTVIPYVPWGWNVERQGPPPASSSPHHPAVYGRYIVIDLDENNRHQREAWAARNPDKEQPSFGFGVCRHGFGLQDLGYLTEDEATAHAIRLNTETVETMNRERTINEDGGT